MRINLPFRCQLRVYASRLAKRTGACSKIPERLDEHILMWDFDDVSLADVIMSLKFIQGHYTLPPIYIIETSPNRFHAYSFVAMSFRLVAMILLATPFIDEKYVRLGVARGYFTLRISERQDEQFRLARILGSDIPEVNPKLITMNEYLTSNRGGKKNA